MPETRWPDDVLDRELRALAQEIDYPATPALATAVGDRLRAEARPAPARAPWWRMPRRVAVAATLSLVILASGILTFSPAAREAVARWLGLRGVRIETVPTLPTVPTPGRSPIDLLLGEHVTLAEARDRAEFDVRIPAELGPPDEVFFDDRLPGGRVTFGYTGEPVSEHTGYRLLLSQFRGSIDEPNIRKTIGEGGTVQPVTIDGEPGFWLGGEDHVLIYLDPDGIPVQDTLRLAGPTLLWEHDGITFRLEGEITLERALEIARSLR
jgi:hypothetical protein